MSRGERARIVCPPSTQFNQHGKPLILPYNKNVIFEVELLDFKSSTSQTR